MRRLPRFAPGRLSSDQGDERPALGTDGRNIQNVGNKQKQTGNLSLPLHGPIRCEGGLARRIGVTAAEAGYYGLGLPADHAQHSIRRTRRKQEQENTRRQDRAVRLSQV